MYINVYSCYVNKSPITMITIVTTTIISLMMMIMYHNGHFNMPLTTDALQHFDGGVRVTVGTNATAGIFTTLPNVYLSTQSAMFDQVRPGYLF